MIVGEVEERSRHPVRFMFSHIAPFNQVVAKAALAEVGAIAETGAPSTLVLTAPQLWLRTANARLLRPGRAGVGR